MSVQTWRLEPGRCRLSVRARSTLHDSVSKGTGLAGTLTGDPDELEATASGTVTAPLQLLSFGDRMRDWSMARHLDLKRHPEASFGVTGVTVHSRDPWRIEVRGELAYHGHTTSLAVEVTGTLDSDRLVAQTRFPLSLGALGIKPPKMLFMKVEETVEVDVELVATTGGPTDRSSDACS